MKLISICKIVGPIMLFFALLAQSVAVNPENLVVGVGGPLSSSNNCRIFRPLTSFREVLYYLSPVRPQPSILGLQPVHLPT